MPRTRNLFEAFARAGSQGLGVAGDMVYPMYQQKQREMQDARDFQAQQDYQNRMMNEQRDWRTQQTGSRNMEAYYGMLGDLAKANRPADPYTPNTLNEAYATAAWNNDPERMARIKPLWMEQNSVEDRPVRETMPRLAPNVIEDARSGYNKTLADLSRQQEGMVLDPATQKYIPNPQFANVKAPTLTQYFDQNVAPMIPEYQRTYPQSFGPNASDSLRSLFTGNMTPPPQLGDSSRTAMIKNPKVSALGEDFLAGKIDQQTYDAWMDYYRKGGQ